MSSSFVCKMFRVGPFVAYGRHPSLGPRVIRVHNRPAEPVRVVDGHRLRWSRLPSGLRRQLTTSGFLYWRCRSFRDGSEFYWFRPRSVVSYSFSLPHRWARLYDGDEVAGSHY